jgi:hypothetical protein
MVVVATFAWHLGELVIYRDASAEVGLDVERLVLLVFVEVCFAKGRGLISLPMAESIMRTAAGLFTIQGPVWRLRCSM